MSDYLLIEGLSDEDLNRCLKQWSAGRQRVRTITKRHDYEAGEIQINGRNALGGMQGKHKAEFAELVLLLAAAGGRAVRVKLRDRSRFEEDLSGWATRVMGRSRKLR